MLHPEQNPFSKPSGPKKPKRELVEAYLGKEAAGLLEDEPMRPVDDMGLGPVEKLSKEEKDAIRKERENRPWTKRQYYDWANSFGKDDEWVDKTFTFHPDGTTSVERELDCRHLAEPILPKGLKEVGGHLYLSSLTSAQGLTLPQSVGGFLDLRGLTSAEGLTLPQSVGGDLYLSSLTSAEGLTPPQSLRGELFLNSLSAEEKAKLRKDRPDLYIV